MAWYDSSIPWKDKSYPRNVRVKRAPLRSYDHATIEKGMLIPSAEINEFLVYCKKHKMKISNYEEILYAGERTYLVKMLHDCHFVALALQFG